MRKRKQPSYILNHNLFPNQFNHRPSAADSDRGSMRNHMINNPQCTRAHAYFDDSL